LRISRIVAAIDFLEVVCKLLRRLETTSKIATGTQWGPVFERQGFSDQFAVSASLKFPQTVARKDSCKRSAKRHPERAGST
jgi:hypothetical protein